MSYQEFLKKIINKESRTLEKMRLAFILFFVLVFGVTFQQFAFSGHDRNATVSQNDNKNMKASVAEILKVSQSQGDVSVVVEDEKEKQEQKIQNAASEPAAPAIEIKKEKKAGQTFSDQNANPDFLPIRDFAAADVDANARAAIEVSEDGKVLYKKNENEKLPIASLTKLVVGIVVTENLTPDDIITITEKAIETEGITGRFKAGEKIKTEDLLKIMLVVSSNDAAAAFSEHFKSKEMDIVEMMNKKARELGLKNTHFTNSVGFDDKEHYSTASDYSKIVASSLKNERLWRVLSIKDEIIKSDANGVPDRKIISSDKLVFKNIGGILGGKTGYTPDAGGCLMVLFEVEGKNGRPNKKIISVVLGAKDTQARFDETEKLINWVREAYIF
ncbi:D-alanyl-D-alanine carboxypeptidase [Candidatus Azambacteria bacterium]|nr:D-alanyl-D-alanine carboxypeptidase [Candidatus Azambacteria bacterium]